LPFILGGFIPSLVGIGLTARTEGRAGLGRLWRRACAFRFGLRWYAAILALPLVAAGAQVLANWATGSQLHAAEPLAAMLTNPVLWVPFTIQIIFLGPLSEEFGWRGYAQDRLLAALTPLSGSLLLGAVWAAWHLPLFFIPGTSQSAAGQPLLQFAAFAAGVISETVVMTWLYNRTGRSLGAAVLLHAAINFTATVAAFLVPPSLLGTAAYAAGNLAVAITISLLTGRALGARAATAKRAA
jgi:membrane protease YdiL (CAAX protease family)